MKLAEVADTIERCLPEGGTWCTVAKANQLAAFVVSMRPQVVLEIGVWLGGSLVPMALAMKYNRSLGIAGRVIAVDPWDPKISIQGEADANVSWWGKQDHEDAYQRFIERLKKHELLDVVEIWRMPSDSASPPQTIDLLHVDGSHTEQAVRDVNRFGKNVRIGGIMILDDLDWTSAGGQRVQEARYRALQLGFIDLYRLGTGMVMQRTDPEE